MPSGVWGVCQAFGTSFDISENRRIDLRVENNLGDAMIEGGDLYGDDVNVAALLERIAETSGVLGSGTVVNYVRHKAGAWFRTTTTSTERLSRKVLTSLSICFRGQPTKPSSSWTMPLPIYLAQRELRRSTKR